MKLHARGNPCDCNYFGRVKYLLLCTTVPFVNTVCGWLQACIWRGGRVCMQVGGRLFSVTHPNHPSGDPTKRRLDNTVSPILGDEKGSQKCADVEYRRLAFSPIVREPEFGHVTREIWPVSRLRSYNNSEDGCRSGADERAHTWTCVATACVRGGNSEKRTSAKTKTL